MKWISPGWLLRFAIMMKLEFNTHGNEKQKQAARYWIDKQTFEIIYGGAKYSGKSFLGCNLIFGDAFTYPETNYFIARHALNDLRKFTIPSIYEVFDSWGLNADYYKYNGQDNLFTLCNGSVVYLLEAKYYPSDPMFERFGSMQMTRGWIEEAGQISEEAKNNLAASTGRWKNLEYGIDAKLLQTCNPSKNYLYKDYKKNKQGLLENHKKFIQALPADNKKADPAYLDMLLKTLSKNQRERLLFGNWEYDDDPTILIQYENIFNLYTNHHILNKSTNGAILSTKTHENHEQREKYITVDVARLGDDKTVIWLWHGLNVFHIVVMEKKTTDEVAREVKLLQIKHNIPMANTIVDADGIGGGVVDQLKGCVSFVNGSSPFNKENFTNLKSQCYFKMADLINSKDILISVRGEWEEKLSEELETVKEKDPDNDGKKSVISKEEAKQLLGRSPDYADALMLRMHPICKNGLNDTFRYSVGRF